MQKYQADHGWQTKLMPDSRALKKLGLGPDYSGAINAQGLKLRCSARGWQHPTGPGSGFRRCLRRKPVDRPHGSIKISLPAFP